MCPCLLGGLQSGCKMRTHLQGTEASANQGQGWEAVSKKALVQKGLWITNLTTAQEFVKNTGTWTHSAQGPSPFMFL